jgi:hypothetical protein
LANADKEAQKNIKQQGKCGRKEKGRREGREAAGKADWVKDKASSYNAEKSGTYI